MMMLGKRGAATAQKERSLPGFIDCGERNIAARAANATVLVQCGAREGERKKVN
jgi:hypothetical protein